MMVRFVYISEIVDPNYLNFLFLIKLIYYTLIFFIKFPLTKNLSLLQMEIIKIKSCLTNHFQEPV